VIVYAARVLYLIGASLFLAAVLILVFYAGMGSFADYRNFDVHRQIGFMVGLLPLVLILLAFAGRFPWGVKGPTGLLFILVILQAALPGFRESAPVVAALPGFRESAPVVAALHPVNALVIAWLAATLILRARGFLPPGMGPVQMQQAEMKGNTLHGGAR